MPGLDLFSLMSNRHPAADLEEALEFDDLLHEIDQARRQDPVVGEYSQPRISNDTIHLPQALSENLIHEIPRDDPTYIHLSSTLINHPHLPNAYLLEYRTFEGVAAYQICAQDIETSGIFESLKPLDNSGDPVFKAARAWSCAVQSIPTLPREVRWVLATIFNFANEMLRPQNDELFLWSMRPWLLHWYELADGLFMLFDISATAPATNWFTRPTVVQQEIILYQDNNAFWDHYYRVSPSRSSQHTVIRRNLHDGGVHMKRPVEQHDTFDPQAISIWLDQVPSPVSSSSLSLSSPPPQEANSKRSTSPHRAEMSTHCIASTLCPRAKEFHPSNRRPTLSPRSNEPFISFLQGSFLEDSFLESLAGSESALSQASSNSSLELSVAVYAREETVFSRGKEPALSGDVQE